MHARFLAKHTVTELLDWDDYNLEQAGRLTHPMRYDVASDRYLPVGWADAFTEIGREFRAIEDRKSVVFYSSGRCSNEASYLYGLLARLYGNNNLPDSFQHVPRDHIGGAAGKYRRARRDNHPG